MYFCSPNDAVTIRIDRLPRASLPCDMRHAATLPLYGVAHATSPTVGYGILVAVNVVVVAVTMFLFCQRKHSEILTKTMPYSSRCRIRMGRSQHKTVLNFCTLSGLYDNSLLHFATPSLLITIIVTDSHIASCICSHWMKEARARARKKICLNFYFLVWCILFGKD